MRTTIGDQGAGGVVARTDSPVGLRVVLFVLIYGGLHWVYQSLRSSVFDPWFIHTLIVRLAAALLDGFEVMALFVAAVLVAELSWRRGLVALAAGCAAVWALNQARILALYWAFRYERELFDPIHTLWGPLLLIAAVAAMYAWAVMKPKPAALPMVPA